MSVFRFSPPNMSRFVFPAVATVTCIGALTYLAYKKLKNVYQNTTPERLAQQVIDYRVSDAGDETLYNSGPSTPPAKPETTRKLKITRRPPSDGGGSSGSPNAVPPSQPPSDGGSPDGSPSGAAPVPPPPPPQRWTSFDLEQAAILRWHMGYPMKMDEASRLVAHNKLRTLWNVNLPNLRPTDAALHANRVVQLAFIPGGDEKDYDMATVSVAASYERSMCTRKKWNALTCLTSWAYHHFSVLRHFR